MMEVSCKQAIKDCIEKTAIAEVKAFYAKRGMLLSDDEAKTVIKAVSDRLANVFISGSSSGKPTGIFSTDSKRIDQLGSEE